MTQVVPLDEELDEGGELYEDIDAEELIADDEAELVEESIDD